MITIIHGDDNIGSKDQLYKLKEQYADSEIITVSGDKITLPDIFNLFNTVSLFNLKRTVIIENLFKGSSEKYNEQILNFFRNTVISDNIIIWEAKEIKSNLLKKYFPKAKVVLCKIPQMLFRFLDSLGVDSHTSTLLSFQNIIKDKEAEFIYVMLLRQLRLLIMVKETRGEGTALASWQIHKLAGQARYFTCEKLVTLYRQLLHLEYKIKTGQTPYTMKEQLDIFFTGL